MIKFRGPGQEQKNLASSSEKEEMTFCKFQTNMIVKPPTA